jgi:hypothetical protein
LKEKNMETSKPVPDMPGFAPPMPSSHHAVFGRAFIRALINAGVPIGGNVQKVVIEAPCNGFVRLYVQYLGDDRLLDVNWSGIEFKIQGPQTPPVPESDKAPAASERSPL